VVAEFRIEITDKQIQAAITRSLDDDKFQEMIWEELSASLEIYLKSKAGQDRLKRAIRDSTPGMIEQFTKRIAIEW